MKVIREKGWGPRPTEEQIEAHDGFWLWRVKGHAIPFTITTFATGIQAKSTLDCEAVAMNNAAEPIVLFEKHKTLWQHSAYSLRSDCAFYYDERPLTNDLEVFIGRVTKNKNLYSLNNFLTWYHTRCAVHGIASGLAGALQSLVEVECK